MVLIEASQRSGILTRQKDEHDGSYLKLLRRMILISSIAFSMTTSTKRKPQSDTMLSDSSSEAELSSHDEDDIFEVERILREDRVEGETFYLVKWLNYVGTDQCRTH